MNSPHAKNKINVFSRNGFYLAVISIVALSLTFWIFNADFAFAAKVSMVVVTIAFYFSLCAVIGFKQQNQTENIRAQKDFESPFNAEIEAKLLALEEANQFFGASLKFNDMFRLIASRTEEIIPYAACALYLADEKQEKLKLAFAVGDDFKKYIGTEISVHKGLVGETFQKRTPQLSNRLSLGEDSTVAENLNSAIAVPLAGRQEVFGVFVLYRIRENEFNQPLLKLFEAVGTRIAPLFVSSQAFESNLTNALTDTLTNLPNERAFYLVLENQIAESQRFRDERPLTILTMDIVSFTDHNQRLGHATGDRLLLFAADKIKNQLRQMDFLARSMDDEFLAVLPTASEAIAREIIRRIEKTFVINPFEASAQERFNLQLNFGAASFGKDGEAAGQLLQRAILRKQQAKSKSRENKILWFPKEYVN